MQTDCLPRLDVIATLGNIRGNHGRRSWKRPAYFDLETVSILREVLENVWGSLRPDQRASLTRSLLAERILKAAAGGERDRERLSDAALDLAA
jgi:hypothetical protein